MENPNQKGDSNIPAETPKERPAEVTMDMSGGGHMDGNKKNIAIAIVVLIILILVGWTLFVKDDGTSKDQIIDNANIPEEGTEGAVGNPDTPGSLGLPATNNGSVDSSTSNVNVGAPPAPAPDNAVVYYRDGGFQPSTLTIAAGRIVTFVNQSSKPMWVASANHPTHEVFSEFDQLKSVPNGGTYVFTFDEVGSWNYHNHVGSSDRGTIIVQ